MTNIAPGCLFALAGERFFRAGEALAGEVPPFAGGAPADIAGDDVVRKIGGGVTGRASEDGDADADEVEEALAGSRRVRDSCCCIAKVGSSTIHGVAGTGYRWDETGTKSYELVLERRR